MNFPGSRNSVDAVAVDVTVQCMDEHGLLHDIDTVLGYRAEDPYAITMTFLTVDGELTWTFARDLLANGLSAPTGDGDVRVSPSIGLDGRALVDIELTSPDGHLVLQVRTDQVSNFVKRAYDTVPAGEEPAFVDMDSLISQLFAA